MKNADVISMMENEGITLKLIDNELAINVSPDRLTAEMVGLLSNYREELMRLLKLEESLDWNKPYISWHSASIPHEVLLVPTGCHPKYRYWLPPTKYFIVTRGDWLITPIVKQWCPQAIEEILRELNASEYMIAKYKGFTVTKDVLGQSLHGKIDEDWCSPDMRNGTAFIAMSFIVQMLQLAKTTLKRLDNNPFFAASEL